MFSFERLFHIRSNTVLTYNFNFFAWNETRRWLMNDTIWKTDYFETLLPLDPLSHFQVGVKSVEH